VAERIANIIILCEDQEHQNLVYRYLLRAGHNSRTFRKISLPGNRQSGSQYVREQFPEQVKACRSILGRRASCLLIVVTDADDLTTTQREQTLRAELEHAGHSSIQPEEPIIILIPKWQVETWIKCLLGQAMSEDDKDSDRPPVNTAQIEQAAETAFDWARPGAVVGATCVPSLNAALPRWRRIG
jgi:hypothetical protein